MRLAFVRGDFIELYFICFTRFLTIFQTARIVGPSFRQLATIRTARGRGGDVYIGGEVVLAVRMTTRADQIPAKSLCVNRFAS